MPSANDQIADALIRHAIGLQRLSTASVRRVLATLRRADARIVERLARGDLAESTRRQQQAILRDIRGILDGVYTDAFGALRIDLDALAEYEAEYLGRVVDGVLPSLGFELPSAEQLHAAVYSRPFQGRILRDWFEDLPRDAFRRLEQEIRQGIVEGRTNAQIIRSVTGTRAHGYRDGIGGINRRAAEVTVRTAVAHVTNAARDRTYKQNRRLMRGVQWVAVLDGRTSAVCRGRDGKVYPVDSGPRPPAHPNCRSTTVPVLAKASEMVQERLTEREIAALDGLPPNELTYGPWLRRQPAAVQDDILGQSRGRLFRRGELPIDRFIDRTGREYTLDELRRREAEAWEAAGLGSD